LAAAPGNVACTATSTGLPKDSVANFSRIVDRATLTERVRRVSTRLVLAGVTLTHPLLPLGTDRDQTLGRESRAAPAAEQARRGREPPVANPLDGRQGVESVDDPLQPARACVQVLDERRQS